MSWPAAVFLFVALAAAIPSDGSPIHRKLEEDGVPGEENKCGGCPCNAPCYSPPSVSPPPPSSPPPSPPPPPKKPPTTYCPPPPPSGGGYDAPAVLSPPTPPQYVYGTGGPGNLYPVDQSFSGAGKRSGFSRRIAVLVGGGFLLGFLSLSW
ncbi:unnamed protein product [Cuscuta epithymum]|uniref:Uncharacterized protein n=1 Tax=Cuscuta epithymum TaxID=186058 RepID=A0AAV0DDL6_9ASTE|nr:unnamed protein product [Cuscuta epithymum]